MIMNRVVLCSLLALVSCSVLEDRGECPCTLDLKVNGSGQKLLSLVICDAVHSTSLQISGETEIYSSRVRRGLLQVKAFSCPDLSSFLSGDSLMVKEGTQMPEFYYARKQIIANREVVKDSICIRKQYSTVNLRLTNIRAQDGDFSIAVLGNVSGMRISDGSLIMGKYYIEPESSDGSYFEFRLPRQIDENLYLDLTSNGTKPPLTRSFKFGEAIGESGYDWSADDLDDIYVEIDCSKVEIHINVLDWEEEEYEERI